MKLVKKFFLSVLNSYSQIFFSKNHFLAIMIILTTFIDLWAGISGLIAVAIANLLSFMLEFNKKTIVSGYYGFNALLVGLGLGVNYEPSHQFFIFLSASIILTLLLTIILQGFFSKYALPYLSMPFLLGLWIVTLASREITSLELNQRDLFTIDKLYKMGGISLVNIYYSLSNIPISESVLLFLKSLGAIFFQYNLLAGVLVAIGLIVWSRIAFILALLGFYSAYFYYIFIGADITELSYSFIGFNYILSALAIGGYFLIPSKSSFISVIFLVPIISLITIGANVFLTYFQLGIYSLPFNFIVISFLYILKFREGNALYLHLVSIQKESPEKNLYYFKNNINRFGYKNYFKFSLPFWGEWTVSQGHNGEITHKEEWRYAWDFVITDDENKTYSDEGNTCNDYYCYNKPVIASFEGYVHEIIDGLEDNKIGEVNINHNWGNLVIIKHTENLYSKVCHLKAGSIKVYKGQYVYKGTVLGNCGNSGRSPYPHLHFQIQTTPFIGSKTLSYPFGNYILNKSSLKNYSIPKNDDKISNIEINSSIFKAFNFIPGKIFKMQLNNKVEKWEVKTDMLNNTYIECLQTKSKAYFLNRGEISYFLSYEGRKKTILYEFYKSSYKILLANYGELKIFDSFPANEFMPWYLKIFQDIIAPFVIFSNSKYCTQIIKEENSDSNKIAISTKTETKLFGKIVKTEEYQINIINEKIDSIVINNNLNNIIKCIE